MKTTPEPEIETEPLTGLLTLSTVKSSPSMSPSLARRVDFSIVRVSSSSTEAVSSVAVGLSLIGSTVIETVAVLLSTLPSLALKVKESEPA